ncbi:aminoglycoside phosphotransferase family protein [Actinacidiphila yanglinensis]|uniref:aminoglycoside phosphotransferase family protein n=1 Tax=Actinacidiphila yanglinensis TaxID=310779 RepID=UPI001F3CF8C2|nr:aminoglycoside phosphotransferase family protein [Actinacidiphila yanglinensis]
MIESSESNSPVDGGGRADGRAGIDAALVRRLLAEQFPQWAGLPVAPVPVDGWDNRTYRLGDAMTVRLPTAEGYVPAVAKENRWLPVLAPQLPVPVPPLLATGEPGCGYPYPWSVRGWLAGETARAERIGDLAEFAVSVAGFVRALQRADASGGPAAGAHSFHRGGPPAHYDDETRQALATLRRRPGHGIDTDRAERIWDEALTSRWEDQPVWFHGDIAHGNLLVEDGRLAAVIDFGTCGVGDPACDLVIAWTMFSGRSRQAFRAAVGHDPATWSRARGWLVWKSLICLADQIDTDPASAAEHRRSLDEVLADEG